MAHVLINSVKDLRNKRYLELGCHLGMTFKAIIAENKISVDLEFPATFQGTTDSYFAQLDANEKFDVIYIDACHDYHFVVRDFNNSLKHLNLGGLIFLHDMIPPKKELTAPHYCGDAFKFLHHVVTECPGEYQYYSLSPEYGDYGLSVFINPTKSLNPPAAAATVSYEAFWANLSSVKTRTLDEMKEILKAL